MAKFQKGVSGNPKGRVKGKETNFTRVRKMLLSHSDSLIQKAVDLALEGDVAALRLCIDRICPPLKARDEETILNWPIGSSLTQQGEQILKAMSDDQISPQKANSLMNCLGRQINLIEFTEWAKRLDEIEKKVGVMTIQSNSSPYAEEAEWCPNDEVFNERKESEKKD